MVTGLSILLTNITFAIIIGLVCKSGHEVHADGVEIFRYQKGMLRFLLAGIIIWIVIEICVLIYNIPIEWDGKFLVAFMVALTFNVILIFILLYSSLFSIKLTRKGITVSSLRRSKYYAYNSVGEILFFEGGKGSIGLKVLDKNGKRLFKVEEPSFEDVLSLCALLRRRSEKYGAIYRHRDVWGRWSS